VIWKNEKSLDDCSDSGRGIKKSVEIHGEDGK
jgi:hypothetical protein